MPMPSAQHPAPRFPQPTGGGIIAWALGPGRGTFRALLEARCWLPQVPSPWAGESRPSAHCDSGCSGTRADALFGGS